MYNLLMKLMLIAALAQFGMTLLDLDNCHSAACVQEIEKQSHDILKVDWQPISVFPEEAKRFK